MSQVAINANTKESRIERIISFLHQLQYSTDDFKDFICLPLAQWLCTEGFTLEDTGFIVTSVANIPEKDLKEIFEDDKVDLYDKSDLITFLKEDEYKTLEEILSPVTTANSLTLNLNEDEKIKIDFLNRQVLHIHEYLTAKSEPKTKTIPIIEAVPYEVIVYDSDFIGNIRTFKVTWKTRLSNRLFVTDNNGKGATIKDIEMALINGAYTHNRKQMGDALTATLNTMVLNKLAVIKDTLDIKGVYYNNGKVLTVKLNTKKPSIEELNKALTVIDDLHEDYSENESTILATVLKWSLASVFSYARKQAGASDWYPWLYFVGAGQSGKTTMAEIGIFFYDVPEPKKNNVGGGSFNSPYRIGERVSRDCGLTIVNETKGVFKDDDNIETIKNSIEFPVSREVQGKTYYAFSPVIFTSNGFIPEMDSLYRRLFIIDFEYNQRKTGDAKKEFERKYNIEKPDKSCLKSFQAMGRLAVREVIKNPDLLLLDWKEFATYLMDQCYLEAGYNGMPEWLQAWSKDKELDDLDNVLIEEIQAILSEELYNARKRVPKTQYTEYSDTSRHSNEFKSVYWDLLNEGAFYWALPHQPWGTKQNIFLNQGFRKLLKKNMDEIGSLKSIAQLMGWNYERVRFGKSSKKGILVPFEEFLEFVYPSVEQ